ncbi:MAG: T9SS type A sorting domain-containing protein [Bacteroidetes bacterium]|nr:T9SS type A sorting domain-containing protein [Bacteroidota bacterium]
MKTKLLITASILMFNTANIKAQVNYENTYTVVNGSEELFLTNLGNNNYKYVFWNYYQNKFSLYNLNHSPYLLNISPPLISDTAHFIGYITTTLFDCDSTNIEYAVMTQSPDITKKFYIYRTDGTLVFSRDSVTVQYCFGCNVGSVQYNGIVNTPAGTKLFLFNGSNQRFIYGLCGTLPENITEINQSSSFVKVFPNPSSHQINFQITPPSNYQEYELTIFNSAFQTVKTTVITGATTQINIDSELLSAGVYFYSLQNKNKVFQTGKINIIH